jgi:hypothetical protein
MDWMGKRKKPPYFQGDQWFNKKVEGRTREALAQRNGAFAREHKAGSKEALLDYVRSEAARLWFTPNAVEIIGGTYIASRFGGWYQAVTAAGLRPPGRAAQFTNRKIYKEEFKRQARLFKQERETAREQRRNANRAASHTAAETQEALHLQELEWRRAHESDSDEELLDYIRRCADELGRTPLGREVQGIAYLQERFGSWAAAVHLAGLRPTGSTSPAIAGGAVDSGRGKDMGD